LDGFKQQKRGEDSAAYEVRKKQEKEYPVIVGGSWGII